MAYDQDLMRGIAKYSRSHGPWAFSKESLFYGSPINKNRSILEDWDVDGIIAHTVDLEDVEEILSLGVPAVVQGNKYSKWSAPTIMVDEEAVGRMAAEHLLEKGLKNFAYCGFGDLWCVNRWEGFAQAVKASGYKASIFEHPRKLSGMKSQNQRLALELDLICDWLTKLPKPIGIMAVNDDRAQDIVSAAMKAGFLVPNEVAIVGAGNAELFSDLSIVPLSSVSLSTAAAGYQAAEILDRMVSGEDVSNHKIIVKPLYVVERKSTDLLCVQDQAVAKALRYVSEFLVDSIGVDDVVEVMNLSRRMAEVRFKNETSYTINAYIQYQRVKMVCEYLIATNLTLAQIADKAGFSTSTYMVSVFKKAMNTTPAAYRKASKLSSS